MDPHIYMKQQHAVSRCMRSYSWLSPLLIKTLSTKITGWHCGGQPTAGDEPTMALFLKDDVDFNRQCCFGVTRLLVAAHRRHAVMCMTLQRILKAIRTLWALQTAFVAPSTAVCGGYPHLIKLLVRHHHSVQLHSIPRAISQHQRPDRHKITTIDKTTLEKHSDIISLLVSHSNSTRGSPGPTLVSDLLSDLASDAS